MHEIGGDFLVVYNSLLVYEKFLKLTIDDRLQDLLLVEAGLLMDSKLGRNVQSTLTFCYFNLQN